MSAPFEQHRNPLKALPGGKPPTADTTEIARALKLFIQPGGVFEIRVLDTPRDGTASGYFNELDAAVAAATKYSAAAPAVYVVMNPVNPALLARANNRMVTRAKSTTTDNDITSRRWLLLDVDAVRPAGISSTEVEHEMALERAEAVREFLTNLGWPDPVYADSGNGAHLDYRIEEPNDRETKELIEHCLEALEFRFSDDAAKVDTAVFNAARIWKLPGTMACKGDSTTDRPHRMARLLDTPDPLGIVTRQQLEALAAMLPQEPARTPPEKSRQPGQSFDLPTWIATHLAHCNPRPPKAWNGAQLWILQTCPWNSEHTNAAAYIIHQPAGKIGAGCHHAGCAGNDWRNLRQLYEPGCYDRQDKPGKSSGNGHDTSPPDYSSEPGYWSGMDSAGTDAHGDGHQQQEATPAPDSETGLILPWQAISFEALIGPPTVAPFVIPGLLPVDVCMTDATGGTGKSTFELFRNIHIILSEPFFGIPIERPGPVCYITAEDDRPRIERRLNHMCRAMRLTPTQIRRVAENFHILDLSGQRARLAEIDKAGNIRQTALVELIMKDCRIFQPVKIDFDPTVRFAPGEKLGNDGADAFINAMLLISRGLSCCAHGIHHVSKAVFREGVIDHLAGRGGGAYGEGARGVYLMAQVDGEIKNAAHINSVYQNYIEAGELLLLYVTKLTDGKRPRDPFIIRRDGWNFELLETPSQADAAEATRNRQQEAGKDDLDRLVSYLKQHEGKEHTRKQIFDLHKQIGIQKDRISAAVALGERDGLLTSKPGLRIPGKPGPVPQIVTLTGGQ